MKEVTGIIDHRILLNFRIDPEVMQRNLPAEFTPKVVKGYAIGGICQVSLSGMRIPGMPSAFGTRSHSAAHRIAVSTSQGEGVYVPRRDTNSVLNVLSGGRLFPGAYSKANFEVTVNEDHYRVQIHGEADKVLLGIDASVVSEFPEGSVFSSMEEVSDFFKGGNLGWSPRKDEEGYDAIELMTPDWNMTPLKAVEAYSGFFSDTSRFPDGSVEFDCATIMRNLKHSWVTRDELCEVCC